MTTITNAGRLLTNAKIPHLNIQSEIVGAAIDLASNLHLGQHFFTKEPYVCHPMRCAVNLKTMGFDETTQAIAICHDLIRETLTEHYEVYLKIAEHLGLSTAMAVETITFLPSADMPDEFFDKLYGATSENWQILAVLGVDWYDVLSNPLPKQSSEIPSELILVQNNLLRIKEDWPNGWQAIVPAEAWPTIDQLWQLVFSLGIEQEII
jgi:hypothetical protein